MPAPRRELGVRLALDALAREGDLGLSGASRSMLPLIRPEDEVRLVPVDPARVVPGMVIAYRREERLVIHRVLACGDAGIFPKGEPPASPAPPLPRSGGVWRGRLSAFPSTWRGSSWHECHPDLHRV